MDGRTTATNMHLQLLRRWGHYKCYNIKVKPVSLQETNLNSTYIFMNKTAKCAFRLILLVSNRPASFKLINNLSQFSCGFNELLPFDHTDNLGSTRSHKHQHFNTSGAFCIVSLSFTHQNKKILCKQNIRNQKRLMQRLIHKMILKCILKLNPYLSSRKNTNRRKKCFGKIEPVNNFLKMLKHISLVHLYPSRFSSCTVIVVPRATVSLLLLSRKHI